MDCYLKIGVILARLPDLLNNILASVLVRGVAGALQKVPALEERQTDGSFLWDAFAQVGAVSSRWGVMRMA